MRRWAKRGVIAASVIAVLTALGYAYFHYRYPYGWSHCCDKVLAFALLQYADEHDGWFPRGEATPELRLASSTDRIRLWRTTCGERQSQSRLFGRGWRSVSY